MFENYQPYIGYVVDFCLISVFIISLVFGYLRSYRESFMLLLIQIFSLFASYSGTILLLDNIMALFPKDFKLSSLLPEEFQVFLQPYEPDVLPFILGVIVCISLYILIKSFLCSFNDMYKWGSHVMKDTLPIPFIGRFISMALTLVSTYTYVIILVVFLGFPMFGIIGPTSLTHAFLINSPVYSEPIQLAYDQSEAIEDVVQTYGVNECKLYEDDTICLSEVLRLIAKEEEDITTFIPLIATEEAYVQFFEKLPVDEVMMLAHVNELNQLVEEEVLTEEFINLYYKELLENKTYDKLVKNQIVLKTSIHVLLNSNILNNENIEELKEYL